MNIVLCAKSSSGKDALYDYIKKNYKINPSVSMTTRPMRVGEVEGSTYHYVTNEVFKKEIENGNIIEHRKYNVDFEGKKETWYYGTSSLYLNKDKDNLLILDINGLNSLKKIMVRKMEVLSILIDVEDDEREIRAKRRGSFDQVEWDRRLKDDNLKFSEENVKVCDYVFKNNNEFKELTNNVDLLLKKYLNLK